MNHKRNRPKNRRAGCLMCKPQKANGAKRNGIKHLAPPSAERVLRGDETDRRNGET